MGVPDGAPISSIHLLRDVIAMYALITSSSCQHRGHDTPSARQPCHLTSSMVPVNPRYQGFMGTGSSPSSRRLRLSTWRGSGHDEIR